MQSYKLVFSEYTLNLRSVPIPSLFFRIGNFYYSLKEGVCVFYIEIVN